MVKEKLKPLSMSKFRNKFYIHYNGRQVFVNSDEQIVKDKFDKMIKELNGSE